MYPYIGENAYSAKNQSRISAHMVFFVRFWFRIFSTKVKLVYGPYLTGPYTYNPIRLLLTPFAFGPYITRGLKKHYFDTVTYGRIEARGGVLGVRKPLKPKVLTFAKTHLKFLGGRYINKKVVFSDILVKIGHFD